MNGVFVTGTDTDCGKTLVCSVLIHALRARGLVVAGFKPVAAGAERVDGHLCNPDAEALIRASGLQLCHETVNPCCFAPAVAPHIAAAEVGQEIAPGPILAAFERLAGQADFVVAEGAGGWRVPLGVGLDMQGLAARLGLPVILVVGIRLGCLNHALLTADAVRGSGQRLLGWIGSTLEPDMPRYSENLDTLRTSLDAPCLGVLPYAPGKAPATLAHHLNPAPMFERQS